MVKISVRHLIAVAEAAVAMLVECDSHAWRRHAWRHGFDTRLGIIAERWVDFIAPCTFVMLQLTQLWMSSCYSNSGEKVTLQLTDPLTVGLQRRMPTVELRAMDRGKFPEH